LETIERARRISGRRAATKTKERDNNQLLMMFSEAYDFPYKEKAHQKHMEVAGINLNTTARDKHVPEIGMIYMNNKRRN